MLRRRFPRMAYSIRPHNITFPATGAIKYLLVLRSLIDFLCFLSALSRKTNLRNKREGDGGPLETKGGPLFPRMKEVRRKKGKAEMQCDMVLLKRPTSLRSETAERQFYIRMGRAERTEHRSFGLIRLAFTSLSLVFFSAALYLFHLAPVLWQCKSYHLIIKWHRTLWAGHCIFYVGQLTEIKMSVCKRFVTIEPMHACSALVQILHHLRENGIRFGTYYPLGIRFRWSNDSATSQRLWSCQQDRSFWKDLASCLSNRWRHQFSTNSCYSIFFNIEEEE